MVNKLFTYRQARGNASEKNSQF